MDNDFNELFPVDNQIFAQNRSWSKSKDQKEYTHGKFSEEELEIIKRSMIKYGLEHNLSFDDFQRLISDSCKKELPKAWLEIAKALPHRTVMSVYNQVKQKLNPENYQGHWSKEEEQQLLGLVEQYGRKFKEISKIMKRTPLNIRDKLRSMGDHNYELRTTTWTLGEFVQFIRLLQQFTKQQILNKQWERILESEFGKQWQEIALILKQQKRRQRKSTYLEVMHDEEQIQKILKITNIQKLRQETFINIPWVEIADTIKTKSKDDLRNLWNQSLSQWLLYKTEINEEQLLTEIINQDPIDENDIDFDQLLTKNKLSKSQKMEAWRNMKKRIEIRDKLPIDTILECLSQNILNKQKSKQTKEETKKSQTQLQYLLDEYEKECNKG